MKIDSVSSAGMFKVTAPAMPLRSKQVKNAMSRFAFNRRRQVPFRMMWNLSCVRAASAWQCTSREINKASFSVPDTLDTSEIIACAKQSATLQFTITNTSSGGARRTVVVTRRVDYHNTQNGKALPNGTPPKYDLTITVTLMVISTR